MKTYTVITPVGISMFVNYKQTYLNGNNNINNAFEQLKALKASELNLSSPHVIKLIGDAEEYGIQEKFFSGHVIKKESKWVETSDKNEINTYASAEISSIIEIHNKHKKAKLKVYLLASDTVLSVLSAKLVKEWFDNSKYENIDVIFNDNVKNPNADYIENLRTDLKDENALFEGFNNLIKKVVELSKDKNEDTIINITGGYKGFIPILTIIAQLEGLKLNYIYEDSDRLIEIGNLPIDFDWAFIEAIGVYLRKDAINELFLKNDKESIILQKLLTDYSLVYKTDANSNTHSLSVIGSMLHDYIFDRSKSQISNTVLGSYIELKYYHLFNENYLNLPFSKPELSFEPKVYYQYRNNEIIISKEAKDGFKEIGDIDLLLRNAKNELVLCEIKSEREFMKYPIEKALARIHYSIQQNMKPVGYLFIVWKSKFFQDDNSNFSDKIVEKFNELINNLGITVNCYLHELKLKNKAESKISYGSLLREKISENDFYAITTIEKQEIIVENHE